jgi:hypothetical protein
MLVMDEALEAQGVAALGVRRKMLKTFEVVRKKMCIDDPTAPPPAAATVYWACTGNICLESGELGWRTVPRDKISASIYKGNRFLKSSITLSPPSHLRPSPYVRLL